MAYTKTQVDSSVRKSNDPSMLTSYLPIGTTYSTATLSVGVWTKILVTTTSKKLTDFAIVDIGAGDLRYQFQGGETRSFRVGMTSAVSSDVSSTKIEFAMSNGTIGVDEDALELGVYATSLAKNATEISPLSVEGYFSSDDLDVIAIWVKADKAASVTFEGMSIIIIEVN